MAELIRLIKESFELSVKMRWLKEIEKAIHKRDKLYEDYQRQRFVISELVKEFKKRYPDDKFTKGGEEC